MNRVTLTLASFLAYFALSGMLAPIGILASPSAAALGVAVSEMVRTLGFFSSGNPCGFGRGGSLAAECQNASVNAECLRCRLLCLVVSFDDPHGCASNRWHAVPAWRVSWCWVSSSSTW